MYARDKRKNNRNDAHNLESQFQKLVEENRIMKQMIDERIVLLARSTPPVSCMNVTERVSELSFKNKEPSLLTFGTLSQIPSNENQRSHTSLNDFSLNRMNVMNDNSSIHKTNLENDLCLVCKKNQQK